MDTWGNSKQKSNFGGRLIMRYYFILLLSSTIFCSSDVEVVQEDHVKIVRAGEDVNLTCTFSPNLQLSTAWFKHTADGQSLQIVFNLFFTNRPVWSNNFEKMNNLNVIIREGYFNLTILNTKPSDSATYYCLVSSYQGIGLGSGTRLIVRDTVADRNTTLHQSLIDTVDPGDSVNLQCSIFAESCAGDHSVYWFKQSSGDSEGVLYTKGERNGRCEKSAESQTQSCVYSLHKNNISRSDTGIYYCAVAACGEILLGRGTQLNIRESSDLYHALLALGISNVIFLALVVFLGIKLRSQNKMLAAQRTQNEDSLNYTPINFSQNPRRVAATGSEDQYLYAMVRSQK